MNKLKVALEKYFAKDKFKKLSQPNRQAENGLSVVLALTLFLSAWFYGDYFGNQRIFSFLEYESQPIKIDLDYMRSRIKIGLINDIHAETAFIDREKLKLQYVKNMEAFKLRMQQEFQPDLIVINGDAVEGTKTPPERSIRELNMVKKIMEYDDTPKIWTIGNHETRSLTKDEWKKTVEQEDTHGYADMENYRIFYMDSIFFRGDADSVPGSELIRGRFSNKELEWIDSQLADAGTKIKMVFIHHPAVTYLPDKSIDWLPQSANKLQKIFEKHGVAAVFGGHIERLYHENINGVDYYVLPGNSKHLDYPGAFTEISMKRRKPEVVLRYRDAQTGEDVSKIIE